MPKKRKLHPLQITITDLLKWRVFEKAVQSYLDPFWFPYDEVPRAQLTHHCHWVEDWHERQNRQYHVFLEVEKLLKQMARHRKIKGFKPDTWKVYGLISGKVPLKEILPDVQNSL